MKISCVRTLDKINPEYSDLILFPEYTNFEYLKYAAAKYPESIIVGAVEHSNKSVGFLFHKGKIKIKYCKVDPDRRTLGSGKKNQNPIYEIDNVCIGILICKDVNNEKFSRKIIERVKESKCHHKIIVIPANMGWDWFGLDSIEPRFVGVNVVLCNNNVYQARCRNFVTDRCAKKIIDRDEEIYITLEDNVIKSLT